MTTTALIPPPGLAELVARPNWVGYKGKVPYQVQPNTQGEDVGAKAGDPTTWDTFAAVAAACAAGRFDGPGYEFHVGEGIIGIDLDDVRDPDTGKLTPLARATVALADTYAEPSPSGRGIHIIGKGELPRPEIEEGRLGKKKGSYELYGGARYFRMTLQPFPGYDEVREIEPATMRRLFALMWPEDTAPKPKPTPPPAPTAPVIADDAALLERARAANDGGEFARLFAGELGSAPGASEADYRLAFRLAFWTSHDAPRIARLMEASGLRRDKWYTRRGAGTWLDYTIARACSNQPERYDPHRDPAPPLSTVDTPPGPCGAQDRIIAELRATVAARDAKLKAIHELMTREGMTPMERVIAYGVVNEAASAQSRKPDDDPEPDLVINQKAIADNVKVSRQAVGEALKRWTEYGHLKKDSRPTGQRTKAGEPISETILRLPAKDLTDNLVMASTWTRPAGTKHVGGNGERCPQCSSTKTKKTEETATVRTTTLACADCGHVHMKQDRVIGQTETRVSFGDTATDIPTMVDLGKVRRAMAPPSTVDTPPCPEADRGILVPPVSLRTPPPTAPPRDRRCLSASRGCTARVDPPDDYCPACVAGGYRNERPPTVVSRGDTLAAGD